MVKNGFGVFEIVVPAKVNGQAAIPHNSKIKAWMALDLSCERPLAYKLF